MARKTKAVRYLAIAVIAACFLMHPAALAGEPVSTEPVSLNEAGAILTNDTPSSSSSLEPANSRSDNTSRQDWGVNRIEAFQAYQMAQEGKSITVAVLDTGIDEDNQALCSNLITSINFANSSTNADLYGHGTHMAGIITAVAPSCQLINVKVADDRGRVQTAAVAEGIVWAVDHGAEVINVSLSVGPSPDLEKAVDYAWNNGALVVAAAGNEGKTDPSYPASYENCLAVAAIDESGYLALLSNHGDWVDVAAPGHDIYSTLPNNQYGYKSGTSPAAAHVSGTAALVFSMAWDINGNGFVNDEARQAIESTCSPTLAEGTGKGCIDAFKAVKLAISTN